MAIIN